MNRPVVLVGAGGAGENSAIAVFFFRREPYKAGRLGARVARGIDSRIFVSIVDRDHATIFSSTGTRTHTCTPTNFANNLTFL